MPKYVTEDWSHFNRAVLRRVGEAGVPAGVAPSMASPAGTAAAAMPSAMRPGITPSGVSLPSPRNIGGGGGIPQPGPVLRGPAWLRRFFKVLLIGLLFLILLALLLSYLRNNVPNFMSTSQPPTVYSNANPTPSSAGSNPSERAAGQPTADGGGSVTDPNQPAERVVTNYTTFHSVDYREGSVVTGWVYGSNREEAPRHEYCYYLNTDVATKVDNKFDLQNRGAARNPYPMSPQLDLSPAQWQEAGSKCHWSTPTSR